MSLIDKDKTVEAIATYLFVNDAIRGPEPRRIADYLVFAQSILTDVPETDVIRCKNCRYRKMKKTTFRGEPYIYYRCSLLEREVEEDEFCSWGDEK